MRGFLIALSLLTLVAVPSWAGGGIGLYGSGWAPDEATDGFGGGIKGEVDAGRRIDVELKLTFFDSQDAKLPGGGTMEFATTIFDLGLAYNFNRDRKINPYVGAGFSYYLFDPTESSLGTIGDEAGWYAEGGLEVSFGSRWTFFAEVLWREVDATLKGDDLGFSPTTKYTYDFRGAGANLGLMLGW